MLVASPTAPAAFSTVVKPTDAVQWVLYYPPLSDAKAEAEVPTAEQCRGLPSPSNQTCLTQRAEVLLRLGRGEAALQDINEALALNPANGDANALRAIIHIARNDKAAALESAEGSHRVLAEQLSCVARALLRAAGVVRARTGAGECKQGPGAGAEQLAGQRSSRRAADVARTDR